MPYLNGKRVSLAEWSAAHPSGERYIRSAGDDPAETTDVVLAARELQAVARQDRALGLVMADIGDQLEGPLVRGEDPSTRQWLDSLEGPAHFEDSEEPEDEPTGEPIFVAVEHEPVVNTPRAPSRGWAEERQLPPSNPMRHSQTPLGRHERYVRQKARDLLISEEAYDARMTNHPDGCPWQST